MSPEPIDWPMMAHVTLPPGTLRAMVNRAELARLCDEALDRMAGNIEAVRCKGGVAKAPEWALANVLHSAREILGTAAYEPLVAALRDLTALGHSPDTYSAAMLRARDVLTQLDADVARAGLGREGK